jgi:WD40 repeat protein
VYACDLCPTDADLAVSGGGDDRALLWRLSTGDVVHTLGGTSRPLAWPLPIRGSPLRLFPGHTDSVSAVTFSSDGRLVAAGGMDGRVHVWDVQSGALSGALEGPDEVMVRGACAYTHTHTHTAYGLLTPHTIRRQWLAWHPKGNLVLAGSHDGSAWLWGSKGTLMNVYAGHSGPVSAGTFTPDGAC